MQTAIYTPTQLSDLLDVDVTGINAGDMLVWDGTAFSPQPFLGGGITFADISGTISLDQFPPGSVATLDSIGADALFFYDNSTGLPKLIGSAEASAFVGLSLGFSDIQGQISVDQLPTGSVATLDTIGQDAIYFFDEVTGLPELISATDAATFVGLPLSFFDILGTMSVDQFPAGTVTTLDSIDEDALYFFDNALFVPKLVSASDTRTFIGVDTDVTLAANSDDKIPSQKAVKAYVDASVGGGGTGDVVGPGVAVNNRVVFFDGTTGKLIKDSGLTLSGSNTGDQDLSGYQPLDADLTAVAALTTDPFGLALLTKTSQSNVRSYIGAGTSSFSGAFSALSGIPTTLSGYGITDAQPLDGDLTTIAGLTATTNNFIVSVASAWASRTPTQVKTTLAIANTDVSGLGTLSTQNGTFSGTSSGTNTGDQIVPATLANVSHKWLNSYDASTGSFTQTQPASGDISGLGTLATQSGTFSGTSSGTNTGDQTISLTSDVTGSGIGSFAATIAVGAVTDAKGSLMVKPAIAVVAVANITLSGEQTIDGQLTASSLVLATAQSTGSQNGPWVSAAGAWARPGWYTSGSTTQAPQFLTTFVRLGTTYQGSTWRMTTASVTIDTTSTTWVQTPTNINSVTGSLALSSLAASTSLALGVGTIELGHASDTTIARSGAGAITVEGAQVILSGAALGTPASGTLTNCTALPISGLTASTSTALGVGSIELGNASDTTLARVSAGVVSIEGSNILMASNLASNVLAFLATPTSANLRLAMTDENGTGTCLFDGATLTALLTTATCGSSLASLNIPAGTVPTTPNDGDIFADANCLYGCTDAGNPGVIPIRHFIRADGTVTYANDTNPHAIFTTPTNGRLTLETGTYRFEGLLAFTGMSATSGNLSVDILGTGGATIGSWLWRAIGADIAVNNAAATTGGWYTTNVSGASIVTAGTATSVCFMVSGTFEVTGAGTIAPSITQVTASASVLSVGSFLAFERIGNTSVTSVGQWD